jgi:hypothetical protein
VQPTGFRIADDNTAAVNFELFVKGTKTQASYAGPTGGGPTVHFDTCKNGQKDGDETDKDCGGSCEAGCGPNAACKVESDCANGVPCQNNKCGLDGKTKATAAKTCKAIKLQFKDTKNGFYCTELIFVLHFSTCWGMGGGPVIPLTCWLEALPYARSTIACYS